MNHKRSLLLKMLLALTLFAGLMFAMAATASAEEEHRHNEELYSPWEYSDRLPNTPGNWYLTSDVYLSDYNRNDPAAWTTPHSETKICLNHHSIIRDKKSDEQGEIKCAVIEVLEDSTLVITDETLGIGHGTISGGDAGEREGGGIIVRGTLKMQNGIITGNKAKKGGGVAVLGNYGYCALYFCDINNNTVPADGEGGGVYVDSTAKLHLGSDSISKPKVSGNKAGDRASDVSIAGGGDWFPIEVGQDGDAGMSSDSKIGIEVRQDPASTTTPAVITTGFKQTPISVFYSNDPRFEIAGSGTEAAVQYKQYTVRFESGREAFGTEQTVYGGQTVDPPATNPEREEDRFVEWLYNDQHYDFDSPVLEDKTLVARFEKDHYHDGKLFSAWTSNVSLPTTAGNYYLTNDVTLAETYKLDSTVDIHICLDGHTVTKADGDSIINLAGRTLSDKPKLSVYDCSNLSTGMLTDASSNGAVKLGTNATFTLNSGSISGNNTVGIYANGSEKAKATAIINGGAISGCAGGIYAMRANIRMNGGTIANNTWIGVELEYHSGMQISGGSIIGNTYPGGGPSGGGGVYIGYDANEFKIIGSDKITITGNTYQGAENNVFFNSNLNKKISFGDDCVMHEDSRIGVTKKFSYSEGDTYAFTSGLGDHAALANFPSDNGDYRVRRNNSGEAELYYDPIDINVTFDSNGGSGEMVAATAKYNRDYELPECTFNPPAGYEKDGWLIGSKVYDEHDTVKLKQDTVVKANWKAIPPTPSEDTPTDKPDGVNPAKPAQTEVGKTYQVGGQTYTVTKVASGSAQGTVAFTKAKNAKTVTVPASVTLPDGKTYQVTQIKARAFAGTKATKVIVKTKKLKKSSVKRCLKGSKVKQIKVKVGKKSANKKYRKKYRKIFTKKNAGRKVKVK